MSEPIDLSRAVYVIVAEGSFGIHDAKTASAAIRYLPDRVVAVIDSKNAGRTVEDVLGFGGPIPVVASLDDALAQASTPPDALLLGVSPRGGRLTDSWVDLIAGAAERRLHIVSPLHQRLADVPAIRDAAAHAGVSIVDLRRPPPEVTISMGRARDVDAFTVLTVGSDSNVGKMTVALQVRDALREAGEAVAFAATGQTGIMVEGWGIAVDAVIADFIAGAAEQLVVRGAELAGSGGVVLVEGQGSLIHPAYSGVTLGLLHGSMPHALILVHDCARSRIRSNGEYDFAAIPPLREMVGIVEAAAAWVRPAPVIGIALKTAGMSDDEARAEIDRVAADTGLPTADAVRFGPGPLVDAVRRAAAARRQEAAATA